MRSPTRRCRPRRSATSCATSSRGEVAPEAVAIATLAVERGHGGSLGTIAERFGEIAEAERGVVVAEVTTAVPLTDALRASLTEKLAAALGRPVSLRERVDASILGGIRINVAGRVLDGSLSLAARRDARHALDRIAGR